MKKDYTRWACVYTLFFIPSLFSLFFHLSLFNSSFLHNYLAFPHILNSSNNISHVEGEEVVISCTIESTPDPDVTWYKDGVLVTESSRIDIRIEDDSNQDVQIYELIISQVDVSDAGVYMCFANNTIIPSSVSITMTLNVTTGKSHDIM